MAFKFKKIKDMDEGHLCNTISCISDNITEERRNECRAELIKRWLDIEHIDLKSLREPDVVSKYDKHQNTSETVSLSIDEIIKKFYNKNLIKKNTEKINFL